MKRNSPWKTLLGLLLCAAVAVSLVPGALAVEYESFTCTFEIVHGTWTDGSNAQVVVTLRRRKDQDLLLMLEPEQIPVPAGPDDGYEGGSWNLDPYDYSTGPDGHHTVTSDKSFVYTYTEKPRISEEVAFKVVNGEWDEGGSDEIKVTVNGHEGDTLKLKEQDIPKVGNRPGAEYKAGSWSPVPDTKTAITGPTTYTYSYVKREPVSAEITFKVVNGEWDGGGTENVTVTLTGLEGDALKLAENQIPSVGSRPSEGFKTGAWNPVPDTSTALTGAVTYTYTYLPKSGISAIVTFRVANGEWDAGGANDITVTLTGQEGDTLKLKDGDIPSAGNRPGAEYKAGSWSPVPDTATAVTGNTSYTYTYAKKETVSATAVFKVVNGEWDEGGSEDVTVTLTGLEGDVLKLAANQIPSAGARPADGCKTGSWNPVPDTTAAVSGTVTYTYTYIPKGGISAIVTFKVANGEWDAGGANDITVTLTGREGDTLRLKESDIPAAGGRPAPDYKAGSWNPVPDTASAVTGDTTYVYTYAAENIVYSIVQTSGTEHTAGNGQDAVITVRRNVSDEKAYPNYTGAAVDGKAIPEGGSAVAKGSLILTLKASFLDTLAEGNHRVTVSFTDGTAETTLTVKAAGPTPSTEPTPEPTPKPTPKPTRVPRTGDSADLPLWLGLVLVGLLGIGGTLVRKNKKHN